ncbi:MAG: hypothetical protein GY938_31900 [Ketobacter sp.]|nr:hypothetical protein [Ketobacter sp.]
MFIDALAMAAKRHLHETTEYRIEYNSELSRGVLFDGLVRIKTVDKPESEATIELIAGVVTQEIRLYRCWCYRTA